MPDDSEGAQEQPPHWMLISVLFSSIPLESEVAWALYDAACDLLAAGAGDAKLHSDAVSGTIRSGEHVVLGTLGGPSFSAHVSTPAHPEAEVRFFVTREGVDLHERRQRRPRRARLN